MVRKPPCESTPKMFLHMIYVRLMSTREMDLEGLSCPKASTRIAKQLESRALYQEVTYMSMRLLKTGKGSCSDKLLEPPKTSLKTELKASQLQPTANKRWCYLYKTCTKGSYTANAATVALSTDPFLDQIQDSTQTESFHTTKARATGK